jgi:hypothetical protein
VQPSLSRFSFRVHGGFERSKEIVMNFSTLPRYPLATGYRPFELEHDRDWRWFFAHLIVVSAVAVFAAGLVAACAIAFTVGQILWLMGR